MSEQRIIKRSRDQIRKGKTDLERIAKLTDAQIDQAVALDEEKDLDFNWAEAELVTPPKKQPVSIRLDSDVLDYFRSSGRGYQTRINSVLRQYVKHQVEKKAG